MIDAHHVPPELQNLLLIVVGNKWPTGDETALRAEAAAWREVAGVLDECARDVNQAWRAVDAGLEGASRAGIDAFLATLVGRPGAEDDAVLPRTIRCCDGVADALDALANEIETLRIEILGALIVLAVQLMVDAALFLFGGAEAAAVEIAAVRVLCLAFLREAAVRVLTRVAESVLAQEGFALLAQVVEVAQGHRATLDGQQLATAAVNGAVGGAVGFGAGLAGGALGHHLGKGLRTAGWGTAARGAAGLVWQGGYGAVAGMAEGAAQDTVFGLSGDWISGAANGAFNGAWGARHTAMNPKNLGSLSPADHLEGALDGLLRRPVGGSGGGGEAGVGEPSSADGSGLSPGLPSGVTFPVVGAAPSGGLSSASLPGSSSPGSSSPGTSSSSSSVSSSSSSSSLSSSSSSLSSSSEPTSSSGRSQPPPSPSSGSTSSSGTPSSSPSSGSSSPPEPSSWPAQPPKADGSSSDPASLHGDGSTGPGERHDGPTGLEGPEVWQDGMGWQGAVTGTAQEEGPGPMASFTPERNPWAELSG
ncbi:hypothetical protein ACGH2B_03720 [Streptomyces sp. BBFR2]|uniref:WXG100-like domain-containing protein n=1 Tax=Streptomyces sp. BBFR2 TaxID=3372854 RepID=UPI0037D9F98C